MKAMKQVGIGMVGAMSLLLSGCGGGGGAAAQPGADPAYPYGQPGYNQQMNSQYGCSGSQTYSCQSGYIQLRNAFGNAQCYPTTVLSEACAQAGGILSTNGATCRKERPISGNGIHGKINHRGSVQTASIRLGAQLCGGESLKVYGNVEPLNSAAYDWDAQLLQYGVLVGSTSSSSGASNDGVNNLSITAMNTGVQQNYYPNGTYGQGQVPQNPQYPNNGQYPYSNGQYPQYQTQYGAAGGLQNYVLQLQFRGKVRVTLSGSAVSCEDGRGNSYPCQ